MYYWVHLNYALVQLSERKMEHQCNHCKKLVLSPDRFW